MLAVICSSAAADASATLLYRFAGGASGANPVGPLISDASGNLYGIAETGGIANVGLVFELSPPAKKGGPWVENILHNFSGKADGAYPSAGLAFDRAGNLYGTASGGGNCSYYCGVAFELARSKNNGWAYSAIITFAGPGIGGGGQPTGNLVFDSAGYLYGTTYYGGYVTCTSSPGPCGTVYRLAPPQSKGGTWTEVVLHSFGGIPDGQFPGTGVALDSRGDVFGVTSEGGTGPCTDGEGLTIGCGTLFEVSPANRTSWNESILYEFSGPKTKKPHQVDPSTVLLRDRDGTLYGSAGYDIFSLSPPRRRQGKWAEHVLHRFPPGIAGTVPASALVPDGNGNFFGTTVTSGLNGYGTVYKLSPPVKMGDSWRATTLQTFTGGLNSEQPLGGVIFGNDGALYGAASNPGASRGGYVFRLTP
jgi:hypothetical protein